jgi:hypothetical protein
MMLHRARLGYVRASYREGLARSRASMKRRGVEPLRPWEYAFFFGSWGTAIALALFRTLDSAPYRWLCLSWASGFPDPPFLAARS